MRGVVEIMSVLTGFSKGGLLCTEIKKVDRFLASCKSGFVAKQEKYMNCADKWLLDEHCDFRRDV